MIHAESLKPRKIITRILEEYTSDQTVAHSELGIGHSGFTSEVNMALKEGNRSILGTIISIYEERLGRQTTLKEKGAILFGGAATVAAELAYRSVDGQTDALSRFIGGTAISVIASMHGVVGWDPSLDWTGRRLP